MVLPFTGLLRETPKACCLVAAGILACKDATPPGIVPEIAYMRAAGPTVRIRLMAADGSADREVTSSSEDQWYPAWSPDGRTIAFLRGIDTLGSFAFVGIYTMKADGSKLTKVFTASPPTVECDYCFFQFSHLTWAPDATRLAFDGNVDAFRTVGGGYRPHRIYTVQLDGSAFTRTNPVMDSLMLPDWYPAWSPDGSKIAFASYRASSWYFAPGANGDIYSMNPDGSGVTRLTDSPLEEAYPAWSPDGRRIAFERRAGPPIGVHIFLMNADGTGVVQLTHGTGTYFHPAWSTDGTRIAFSNDREGNWEIYVINVDGTGETRLTHNPTDDFFPTWRPR